jgi:type II secretory pathway pseudopilin PulG
MYRTDANNAIKHNNKILGFTLVELMVMITVIAILASMIGITLSAARVRTRDAKRLSNAQEVGQALEEYYNDENQYPAAITPGNPLVGPTSGKTYLAKIPNNPNPKTDGDCPNEDYNYATNADGSTYYFAFCLGHDVNDFIAGTNNATPAGIK